MGDQLRLQTGGISPANGQEASATFSPARGAEMRNFLQERLQKNRAPALIHCWEFWHDSQSRASSAHEQPSGSAQAGDYEHRLSKLKDIEDVRSFWEVFNNFPVETVALRDSVHLFHKGVKPVWEDPRNEKGGSWTFRVPKEKAVDFWKELCVMAIGEKLQAAVESERTTFRDDICGVSLSVRPEKMLLQVWNRDSQHAKGIQRILQTILENLSSSLKPEEGSYYYKKHNEHKGFTGTATKD